MPDYTKPRKKARTPLGRYIAAFLDQRHDNEHQARELFGERAAELLAKLQRVKIRSFQGSAPKYGAELHDANAPHVGRFLAYVALVLEQCGPQTRKACTRRLFQGRTRRWDRETQRVVYVPAREAGGLAARLGVSPRQIQLYGRVARFLGLWSSHQVKASAAVEALPRDMRGKRWSYSIFRWLGELPRAVMSAFVEWGRVPGRSASDRAQAGQEAPPASRPGSASSAAFLALLARLDAPPT